MRRISFVTLLTLAVGVLLATASRADERSAIARLEVRDRVLVITNGLNGLQYSVSTKEGNVLDANLSEAQLVAKYPDVYDTVRPAIANREATPDVIPWAGK